MLNSKQRDELNAITDKEKTSPSVTNRNIPPTNVNVEFDGITSMKQPDSVHTTFENMDNSALVMPENANTALSPETEQDINETITPIPIGHDTATTTDEEEAAEALLALGNIHGQSDDDDIANNNATLMPVGKPSVSIDINLVPVKLGTDDIIQAIKDLPKESRLDATKGASQVSTTEKPVAVTSNDVKTTTGASKSPNATPATPTANIDLSASPVKGTLKVKNYGLKKSRQTKQSYKCQKCGHKE